MNDNPATQAILSLVRSGLIAGGGLLTARGIADSETVQTVVGAMMAILVAAWGMYEKYRSERKTKEREVVAVQVGMVVADNTVGPTPLPPPAAVPAMIAAVAPTLSAPPTPEKAPLL